MSVLLLRLAGPLQAWGSASKFNRRSTEREPTKSGVIGLAAAALGIRRTDSNSLERIASQVNFAVRIDQIGRLVEDFHTAGKLDDQGKRSDKNEDKFVSYRFYLADAVFVAGLEGDIALLRELDAALQRPVFPLFLGRRSCPPTGRLSLGIHEGGLLDVLMDCKGESPAAPWQAAKWYKRAQESDVFLEIVRDARPIEPNAFVRRDRPVSFSQEHRKYAFRHVFSDNRAVLAANPDARRRFHAPVSGPATDHDAMRAMEED